MAQTSATNNSVRVLVVDDNEAVRRNIEALLLRARESLERSVSKVQRTVDAYNLSLMRLARFDADMARLLSSSQRLIAHFAHDVQQESAGDERDQVADERDKAADEREAPADGRGRIE